MKNKLKRMISIMISMLLALIMLQANVNNFSNDRSIEIKNLKVEYSMNPIGIDCKKPRFSWNMESKIRGEKQTYYQILVSKRAKNLTLEKAEIWNSGKVKSDKSVGIEYSGKALEPCTKYYWKVIVWDNNNNVIESSGSEFFETGLMSTDGVTRWDGAKWISIDSDTQNLCAPMIRKESKLTGKVRSARLYMSSLGVYDAYVNGKKLGAVNEDGSITEELLNPGWTNYDKTINYMTYNITDYIKNDDNLTLGVILGNGWYNGRISEGSTYYSEEGNELALLAKIVVTYEDNSKDIIITNTESGWKATNDGPVISNDIYDGEEYDARKEMDGWSKSGFDDSKWNDVKEHNYKIDYPEAKVVGYSGNRVQIIDELTQIPKSITVYDDIINEDSSKNARGKIKVDTARSIEGQSKVEDTTTTLKYGETAVYDLGQNIVGVPYFEVKGESGTQVKLHLGEILNDDSEGADGPKGTVYFANLRTAKQSSLYTLKGDKDWEIRQDSLTYYGFRYIEVTVLTPGATVELKNIKGKVASSSIDQTGNIETSNKDINKLAENIMWGQRGNYFWIPTDCPQRDERLGWTGDTQLFANTAMYNADSVKFLENYMDIIVDSQEIYGLDSATFTSTAPGGKTVNFASFPLRGEGPKGQSGWADVGIILPWTVWQMTGDTAIIEKNYDAMTKYMDWIYSETGESYEGPGSIGDWLAFQGTSNQFMSHVYYAYDAKLMAQMANSIGKNSDYKKYTDTFDNIKKSFIKKYITYDENGKIIVKSSLIAPGYDLFEIKNLGGPKEDNSQAALLWILKLELYENDSQKEELTNLLINNIRNSDEYKAENPNSTRVNYDENTLSVGFLGINVIAPVLTDIGHPEVSYDILLQDSMPSWLYSVKNGSTTIWERWNSYSSEDGFGDVSMNSFNHYSYGAIGEWMYKYMAGISNDSEKPGFKHIILKPTIDNENRITQVKASYDSVYGTITSEWKNEDGKFTYKVKVPANTTATIYIPTDSSENVKESGKSISNSDEIKFIEYKNGNAIYKITSGSYEFTSDLKVG
ncbi:MAG: glycoside hydrolase family 78 protein [Clostridium sp.]|uniref:glycoside hydrolase family 78 protein n=1 Tax=Clostridium neonatale TaxID=137838 RepID=UPI001D499C14|nr:glycoside hydrolase family 78 protein [Clostridium sp.]CAI3632774.1 alpha-L-rhamnosidase [Clostridium neonatale]